jgi:CRISPR-associated protein Cas5d
MRNGVIEFPKPEQCETRRFIRKMDAKKFDLNDSLLPVDLEESAL